MPITVPTYDEYQFLLDRLDADERALADLQGIVSDQVGRLTAQVVVLEAVAESHEAQIAGLTETVARLRRRVAALEVVTPPVARQPLFAAKPGRTPLEPGRANTEAEYAESAARAGAPYPIHRHYATSWAEALSKATGCVGEWCALTVSVMNSSRNFVVDAGKLAALPDRPILLGWHHEPEDDIDAGVITLAEWLAAQVEVRSALGPINALRNHPIRFGGTLMGFTWRGANSKHTAESLYPGDGVWDHLGTDVYPGIINASNQFIDPVQLLGHEVAFGEVRNLDVCVFEWGITTSQPGRADYIRRINQYARDTEMLAVSYWDHGDCYLRNDDEFAAAGGL